MTEIEATKIARDAFIQHEGREMVFEGAMPWVISAIKAGAAAGYQKGYREADKEAREGAIATATEARWQERQGEDYGSF